MVRMISPIVRRGSKGKTGKGFSLAELREVGLNPGEARHLGIPVDVRRSTSYPENVESLKEWVEEARREGFRVPRPKQSSKGQRGRAHRGLTSSGKKMRALRKS
ncbi:MAG: ribosomal protein L13e [Candidatus Bathyarchaeota archaeon]|nr:MAG: ribosomal protein L13e [Candidatus Bathyarchaeota archaeon]